MPLNRKTTVIATYTRRTSQPYYAYKIDGVTVERKEIIYDLGVLMDSKLLLPQHVESVASKARRKLVLIKWVRRHFTSTGSV